MKKLIMIDLDNTLLPIDQEIFAALWLKDISKKFCECGMDPKTSVEAVKNAIIGMLKNDGEKTNDEVFFEIMEKESDLSKDTLEPFFSDYYENDFINIKSITKENPFASQIARLAREKSEITVIATMPLFPRNACDTRLSWAGVDSSPFDMVTSFDKSSYSKPDPRYFEEILSKTSTDPKDALMIGNDVREDIVPCEALGISSFLVTDNIITHSLPYESYRQGDSSELIEYLKKL